MNRITGWIIGGIGAVAVAAAALWLTRPEEEAAAGGPARAFVVPVTLTELERGDVEPRALLSGTVRSSRRARLGFDTSGILQELVVQEADQVGEGQVLARLERGDEEHELAAAEASLALAQRQHDLLLAGERDEEKRRLQAVLEAARAEAELARLQVERGEKLLADRIISQAEQDVRTAAFDAADKRRVAAEEEVSQALAGSRAEDLAIAVARVEEARARASTAEHALSKTGLVAPWGGSIVHRFVSTGDYVSAGDPVFELVDLDHIEVHLEIPGRFAALVGPDSRVRLTTGRRAAFVVERTLDATIPAADEAARSFRGIVRLAEGDDPQRVLKPGMFVEAELYLRPVRDALCVDADAVLSGPEGPFLVRALQAEGANGEPQTVADLVPVFVRASADGKAAVEPVGDPLPPLSVGDSIVLVGADNAFPGAQLLPRSSEPGAGGPPAAGGGPGTGAGRDQAEGSE